MTLRISGFSGVSLIFCFAALRRRITLQVLVQLTNLRFVGAFLEEPVKEGETPKMKGSAMLIRANSKEEVIERLKNDVYVTGGVWDWDKVQVFPFKSALRKAL